MTSVVCRCNGCKAFIDKVCALEHYHLKHGLIVESESTKLTRNGPYGFSINPKSSTILLNTTCIDNDCSWFPLKANWIQNTPNALFCMVIEPDPDDDNYVLIALKQLGDETGLDINAIHIDIGKMCYLVERTLKIGENLDYDVYGDSVIVRVSRKTIITTMKKTKHNDWKLVIKYDILVNKIQ